MKQRSDGGLLSVTMSDLSVPSPSPQLFVNLLFLRYDFLSKIQSSSFLSLSAKYVQICRCFICMSEAVCDVSQIKYLRVRL